MSWNGLKRLGSVLLMVIFCMYVFKVVMKSWLCIVEGFWCVYMDGVG